jgi:hypothetical protein
MPLPSFCFVGALYVAWVFLRGFILCYNLLFFFFSCNWKHPDGHNFSLHCRLLPKFVSEFIAHNLDAKAKPHKHWGFKTNK